MFDNLKVVEGSINIMKKLSKNNNLIIITARPSFFENKTLSWLNRNYGDIFDNIYHSSDFHIENNNQKSKVDFCKDLGVKVIIEDNLEYSLNCAEKGFDVILLDKPWNKGVEHENIVRCFNWSEILREIKRLDNE